MPSELKRMEHIKEIHADPINTDDQPRVAVEKYSDLLQGPDRMPMKNVIIDICLGENHRFCCH